METNVHSKCSAEFSFCREKKKMKKVQGLYSQRIFYTAQKPHHTHSHMHMHTHTCILLKKLKLYELFMFFSDQRQTEIILVQEKTVKLERRRLSNLIYYTIIYIVFHFDCDITIQFQTYYTQAYSESHNSPNT